ncbi:MAG: dihydropteroate synthase [Prevotella sp.]|uniref:dihydropteroate synthase n=1 Tax=Prevotella sp. TaxID=59823 RepID=UPI002A324FF3|nr:dihydropteroate synthase [Prevotella sp.]MDD7317237.1 dihydropteroate synthase [Prevotellaceae bacterium]MDY4019841.1 dihydropteroate synthase [Prevotella sp.]
MIKNHNTEYTLNIGGRLLSLSEPVVMGILNCTPDSFYRGSRTQTEKEIAMRANRIVEEGGKIIDVGAFSTRPGAAQVSEAEEMERMRRALATIRGQQADAIISIDTFRHSVAKMAVDEFGACIINDVSGGNPQGSFGSERSAADFHDNNIPGDDNGGINCAPVLDEGWRGGMPYILMSSCGSLEDTMKFFALRIRQLRARGQRDIILDPGFGFGKTMGQNFDTLQRMDLLGEFGLPVLAGISRKTMIWRTLGITPDEALNGTSVLNAIALAKGASILRVHDVKEAVEAVTLVSKLR